jgi:hypothetical protein
MNREKSDWFKNIFYKFTTPDVLEISKSNLITGLDRPLGFQEVEAPRFLDHRHMKVVRLSALRTGCLYPPGNIPGTHFCLRLSRPQGRSAARRIMSMKNSNNTIGNRTRVACSTVPQPTAPPRALRNQSCVLLCVQGQMDRNASISNFSLILTFIHVSYVPPALLSIWSSSTLIPPPTNSSHTQTGTYYKYYCFIVPGN